MFLDKYIKYLLIGFCFCFSSCQYFETSSNAPDVSDIEVDLKIKRFDKDLFELDTTNIGQSLGNLARKYPDFYPFFTETLMEWSNDSLPQEVKKFISHPDIQTIFENTESTFADFETYRPKLVTAFKYFKYYFPKASVPEIITYISAFRQMGLTLDQKALGVGLDFHLGKNYPFYPTTGYPQYLINSFGPDYMTSHMMKVWAQQLYPESLKESRFIDRIVYQGKLLYFLDLVLPDAPDYAKMDYLPEQLEWCHNSERQIWSFFIEQKMLYESESRKYVEYINPGPTSSGMPKKSPGNVGSWLGWQIVRKYMEMHPETTIQDLWQIRDGQEILQKSKYKP